VIGWYVHHQGRGHLHRAAAVAAVLDTPVTGLSSLPDPGAPFAGWVPLADDAAHPVEEVTAGGALHWAPRGHDGMRERMARLAAWVDEARPDAVVVDVSVEVSVFLRLMGVPVVVTAMPGDRTDAPHTTGYTVAERVLAFWPRDVLDPPWLTDLGDRVVHVGAVSRFDGRPPADAAPGTAVLLAGGGGSAVTAADVDALRAVTPGLSWTVLGGPGEWTADPWPVLSAADVVVTHAGQNALAEVAAARRPAVVVAQDRPFREQHRTTEALHRSGIAVGLPRWPDAAAWPRLLEQARTLGGGGWDRWSPGDAAVRAAAEIRAVARTVPTP
jgi:predicted glycosyltransferase